MSWSVPTNPRVVPGAGGPAPKDDLSLGVSFLQKVRLGLKDDGIGTVHAEDRDERMGVTVSRVRYRPVVTGILSTRDFDRL